jgi:hypothetical protein
MTTANHKIGTSRKLNLFPPAAFKKTVIRNSRIKGSFESHLR